MLKYRMYLRSSSGIATMSLARLSYTSLGLIYTRAAFSGLNDGAPALIQSLMSCFSSPDNGSSSLGMSSRRILRYNPDFDGSLGTICFVVSRRS